MDGFEITGSIDRITNGNFGGWNIGITDDIAKSKTDNGAPTIWYNWRADTEGEAKEVEGNFTSKGMQGVSASGATPQHVYMFRTRRSA